MNAVHILVAEDERHVRLTLGLALRQAGYRVTLTEDGMNALERMLEFAGSPGRVDMLITDIQMPYLDGLSLLDHLRERGINIPVVCITGRGDKNLIAELRRRGCREYLDKPFTPGEVLLRVEKVLEKCRQVVAGRKSLCCPRWKARLKIQEETGTREKELQHPRQQSDWSAGAGVLISQPAGTEKLPASRCNRLLTVIDCPASRDKGVYCGILPKGEVIVFNLTEEPQRIRIELGSEMRHMDRIILEVRNFMDKYGPFEPSLEFNIILRELLINAVEHGNLGIPERRILVVIAKLGKGRFRITVQDEGRGFDHRQLNLIIPDDPRRVRGRGLSLVHELSEKVEFNEQGNRVSVVVRLAG